MELLNDGTTNSNSVFWDSNTTFRRFVPWKMITNSLGVGHGERSIFIFRDSGKFDFAYNNREVMFQNLQRLLTEAQSLPDDHIRNDANLVEKVEKMYYAPGMPGFEEAQASFNSVRRQKESHDEVEEREASGMCDKCLHCYKYSKVRNHV